MAEKKMVADLVDHLSEQVARLHVVVSVLEDRPHHLLTPLLGACRNEVLQRREQVAVDEG
jgi:hypothetical protein